MLVPMAAISLAAFGNAAEAGPGKWRVTRVLIGDDERTCGPQHVQRFNVEIKDGVVRRWSSSGAARDLKLLAPLNGDGSGKVIALNSKNQEVALDIDPGTGPRTIRYTRPYSVCSYAWIPV